MKSTQKRKRFSGKPTMLFKEQRRSWLSLNLDADVAIESWTESMISGIV
ncbi:MAG TPA: hypothetical protein VLF94_07025 [Chlamydiales bacterium]|nr:hypothetical protein [Chlamydiales bacterium]